MVVTRLVAAMAVCLSATLGGCSPFAGFVADHWPHLAGGEPNGVPPRPGTPGYAAFIAHGQSEQDAGSPAADGQQTATVAPNATASPDTALPPPQAPALTARPTAVPDHGVVGSGLY